MSVSYGFYNSLNGDRKYDANQISSIFDGLIIDGVFASIGTAFVVKASKGLLINVGIGKAWFNHTWTLNDSILPIAAPEAEVLLDRIDAIIIDVNSAELVRENDIKFIKGMASSKPIRPTMISEKTHHQYPLCYIYRTAGSSSIVQANITNTVGTLEAPFVTGILQTISLDELLLKWQDTLDQFVAREQAGFLTWFELMKKDLTTEQVLLDEWIVSEQTDFLAWFNQMKGQLDEDSAGHLQLEIDKEEVKRILLIGFVDGSKVFSDDGMSITSTATDGRTLVKTFTDDFLTMTNVLKASAGAEVARMVKTFDSSGKLIDTIVTYL